MAKHLSAFRKIRKYKNLSFSFSNLLYLFKFYTKIAHYLNNELFFIKVIKNFIYLGFLKYSPALVPLDFEASLSELISFHLDNLYSQSGSLISPIALE